MSDTLKIAGLGAALATALVAGLMAAAGPGDAAVPTRKAFTERLPQAALGAPHAGLGAPHAGLGEPARLAPAPLVPASPRGDALREADGACAKAAWPYLPRACLVDAGVADRAAPVRTITIEQRLEANTSTLVRVPAARVAAR